MCTVTLFPVGKSNFVLTSNRDESPKRISLPPRVYEKNGINMIYPKDKLSGGSWIGASEKNRVLCVLNGGFTKHSRKEKYRLSRGIVMKDLLICDNIKKDVNNYKLDDIEPFTLIIADWNNSLNFFELVWDGKNKHFKKLELKPHIWSSSTLFNGKMKLERQQWFNDFLNLNELSSKTILDFHQNTKKENTEYGVVMDRLFVKTTSITQVIKESNGLSIHFNNLINNNESSHRFNISHIVNG